MLKREIVFGACATITPDFAAQLANRATQYESEVYLEHGTTSLCVDSLIGILAMDLRKGMKVTIAVDGPDAEQAMHSVCELMQG